MANKYGNDEVAAILSDPPTDEEDALERWSRPQPEPRRRQRKLDTCETDWSAWNDWCDARIDAAVAAEREYEHELLAHVVADTRGDVLDDIERAIQPLTAELASLKATLAELRVALAEERSKTLDLPNVLGQRAPRSVGG